MPQPQLPPQLPPQAPLEQQQQQDQYQTQDATNQFTTNTPSESNSVSESENISSNAAHLSAYQINNASHEASYYRYSNGTSLAGTSLYSNLTVLNNSYSGGVNITGTVGIRHTFGGRAKRLALQSVANENLKQTLSTCDALGVFDGRVTIDYSQMPSLEACQYIKPAVQVAQATNEITELRLIIERQAEMLEQTRQLIWENKSRVQEEANN